MTSPYRASGRPTRASARTRTLTPTMVILCVASALLLLPVLWAVSTSLKRPADVFAPGLGLIPSHPTLDAYRSVFSAVPFGRYLLNSVLVTSAIVVLNVVFDSCAAYAFAKLRFPGRTALFGLLLVTMMIPMQINLIPLYRMMVWIHVRVPALGADTLSGIIAPSAVQVFGIFMMRQFFASIPDSLIEAARLDGAGELAILWRVILPISRPGLATLTIFTLLHAWNDFLWPLIIAGSDASRTLPVGLALLSSKNTVNWSETMAGSVVTALPMVIVFIVLQRQFIEGLTAGAAKDLA
jgi:multiple sugar transport system permease protein